jgi:hypothetical protein
MPDELERTDRAKLLFRWKAGILSAAAFAFLCKIALALTTFGTNDVCTWERFSFWSRLLGAGVYRSNQDFNHPPSMIYVLRFIGWLADTSGIAFPFWMRLPAILADAASLWIVWRVLTPRLSELSVRWGLLLVALSPVLILVSGFHGNTDSVMIFFLLLSVWLATTESPDWTVGAAFGAALCIKVVPLVVLPVMFFYLRGVRRRAVFLASTGAFLLIAWSPFVFEEPGLIMQGVFGYRSTAGVWGITWLLNLAINYSQAWQQLRLLFQNFGGYAAIAVIAVLSYWMNRATKPDLFSQVGAMLCFFLVAANGFGVQYLAWLVPWTAGIGVVPAAMFAAAGGTYLFMTYDYWAGGLPWYMSDFNFPREYSGQLDYPRAVCWLSVVVLAWAAWRRIGSAQRARSVNGTAFEILRGAVACLAMGAILAPLVTRALRPDAKPATSGGNPSVTAMNGADYIDLALRMERAGKIRGTVGQANSLLALHPELRRTIVDIQTKPLAEFWNSLAESYAARGEWDESIMAAKWALAIDRRNQNAAGNLTLAIQRKGLGSASAK